MHPKNKTDFVVMAVIFMIILGAATGGVLLRIRNQSIETELWQKKQQLAELKRELESVQTNTTGSRETVTPVENQVTSLLVAFDSEQQEIFKVELERLATENHLMTVKSELAAQPTSVKDNPDYQVSQWYLVLTGDYRGVNGFMETLPQNTRLAMIDKLKITTEYLNENQYQLTARLTLDVISKKVTRSGE